MSTSWNPAKARSVASAVDWNCVVSKIGYTGAARPKSMTLCMKEMKVKFNSLKAHPGMFALIISLCTEGKSKNAIVASGSESPYHL